MRNVFCINYIVSPVIFDKVMYGEICGWNIYLWEEEDVGDLDTGGRFIKNDSCKYLRSVIIIVGTCDRDSQSRISVRKMVSKTFHGIL
jgi:hypothetical protein